MTPEKREFKEAFIQLLPKAWQRVSEMLKSELRTSGVWLARGLSGFRSS